MALWTWASLFAVDCAGYQEIAQWLHGQDPESWFWTCGHACTLAARYGFLHILRWLSTAAPPGPDDIGPCTEAAARGRLAILQWARAAGYAWDESTYVAAAAVSFKCCSDLGVIGIRDIRIGMFGCSLHELLSYLGPVYEELNTSCSDLGFIGIVPSSCSLHELLFVPQAIPQAIL